MQIDLHFLVEEKRGVVRSALRVVSTLQLAHRGAWVLDAFHLVDPAEAGHVGPVVEGQRRDRRKAGQAHRCTTIPLSHEIAVGGHRVEEIVISITPVSKAVSSYSVDPITIPRSRTVGRAIPKVRIHIPRHLILTVLWGKKCKCPIKINIELSIKINQKRVLLT